MKTDESFEMPDRPSELDTLRVPTFAPSQKAALWSRIEASALAVPVAASLGAAAAHTARAFSAKAAGSLAVATLVIGAAGGVAVDRYVLAPEPKVVERVVVQVKEVPVPSAVVTPAEKPPAVEVAPRREQAATNTPPKTETDVELQSVEGARMALIRRDPLSALQTLDVLSARFPQGRLVEERESLRIQALQQAGRRDEAQTKARTFLKLFPNSVFVPIAEAVLQPNGPGQ